MKHSLTSPLVLHPMIDFSFRLDFFFAQECFLSTYCALKDNVGKKSHPWKVDEEFCKLGNSADSLKALQLEKKNLALNPSLTMLLYKL